jgi:hypothetical protein
LKEIPTETGSTDNQRIKEFWVSEPMIYDLSLESEIKYLSIIPLNGDPFIFIPGQ